MQTTLPFVDPLLYQQSLDQTFGQGVFQVTQTNINNIIGFALDYANSTPQSQIDQALVIANENAATLLAGVKVRLYDAFETVANKIIASRVRPVWSDAEIAEAAAWLQNQSTPVPSCVIYNALREGVSNAVSAQQIIDAQANYQAFIDQVNSVKNSGQTATLAAPDILSCKLQAGPGLEQLKNLG